MIVAFACDHGGFSLRETILKVIKENSDEVLDFGIKTSTPVDFPDYVAKVCKAIQTGEAERGIVACGSGVGACITANKFHGIFASVCHDVYSAHQGVEHDQMNTLCLGGRIIGTELAAEIVKAFLNATVMSEERYQRRVEKIREIERRG